ncbi:MAG: PLP-dependent transferase [Kiloniellales bacterium]|nr:PLP-dependent transferase [Kiloniellales bacterium]
MARGDGRNKRTGFSTRAIHLGYDPFKNQRSLTPPVYMTSTYAFESAEEGGAVFSGETPGFTYGRTLNPTQALLQERLASLEDGEAALAFASGIGAISTLFWTLCRAGDIVLCDKILYGSTYAFLKKGLAKFHVDVRFVDLNDEDALASALGLRPRILYFETPANPNLRLIDVARVCEAARAAGALSVVDNTFATPYLQRPLTLGADLVVHSMTKYLGGHGDLLAGAVIGPKETVELLRKEGLRFNTGATISPLNAFLVMRGLKTLELRMERHCISAQSVAGFLASHPKVAQVHYPYLENSTDLDLAKKQMSAGGGLVSFELRGGMEAGRRFINALEMTLCAVSLGDAETLAQHPASMTHFTYSKEERAEVGITDGLIRLSIGLENLSDILDDFSEALEKA